MDGLTFGYWGFLSLLVLVFHENLRGWEFYILKHGALMGGLLCLLWGAVRTQNRIFIFLRNTYPLLLMPITYRAAGLLVHLTGVRWIDPYLITLDLRMFGVYPSVWLGQKGQSHIVLTEYMNFFYASYYLLVALFGGWLCIRRQIRALDDFATAVSLSFYTSCLLFILLPAQGPRFTLSYLGAHQQPGWFFTRMVNFIMDTEAFQGCAFPSSHIAVAVVILLSAWHGTPRLRWIIALAVTSLSVATVYGGYHYVMDVLAGITVGVGGYVLAQRIQRGWYARSALIREQRRKPCCKNRR